MVLGELLHYSCNIGFGDAINRINEHGNDSAGKQLTDF